MKTLFCAISLLSALFAGTAFPAGLQIQGQLVYSSEGTAGWTVLAKKNFSVDVYDCRWLIRSSNLDQAKDGVSYIEVANGGDSIYTTKVFNPAALTKTPSRSTRSFVSNAVTVVRSELPFMDEAFASAIWLGYASGCSFDRLTNSRIQRVFTMNPALFRPDITVPFTSTYETAVGGRVLRELLFHNEGFFWIRGPGDELAKKQAMAPFDKGFVEARYTATEFTNVLSVTVPRKFKIEYFTSKKGAASAHDAKLFSQIEIEGISFRSTSDELPLPTVVAQRSMVYDSRIIGPDHGPLTYMTTNKVYSTNDPKIGEIQQELEKRMNREKPRRQRSRLFGYSLLGFSMLGLAISLWVVRARKQ